RNETVNVGDATTDARALKRFAADGPESLLAVSIKLEEHVLGGLVLSVRRRDQFSPDDETTLQIFAGYAAQAIVNSNQLEQLDSQRREPQGQRREEPPHLHIREQTSR